MGNLFQVGPVIYVKVAVTLGTCFRLDRHLDKSSSDVGNLFQVGPVI